MFQYKTYFKHNTRGLRLTLKREARNIRGNVCICNIIINFKAYI